MNTQPRERNIICKRWCSPRLEGEEDPGAAVDKVRVGSGPDERPGDGGGLVHPDEIGDEGGGPAVGVVLALPDLDVRLVLGKRLVAGLAEVRAAAAIFILFGLARRTARQIEKVSLSYSG